MKVIDTHKRSIIKTVSWRVIAFLITFIVAYIWTRDLVLATSLGVAANLIKMVAYYVHERAWNNLSFGKIKIPSKGFTLWFTGLPSSGKSTLADALAPILEKRYSLPVERIDGDVFRKTFSSDLGFSQEDRLKNIQRMTQIAGVLTKNRAVVLTSFVSPYKDVRNWAREQIGNFVEVYVKCPVEECIRRDPKGNYKKALSGQIAQFTGISDPYEEPEYPEIVVETDKEDINQCTQKIISSLKKMGYLD